MPAIPLERTSRIWFSCAPRLYAVSKDPPGPLSQHGPIMLFFTLMTIVTSLWPMKSHIRAMTSGVANETAPRPLVAMQAIPVSPAYTSLLCSAFVKRHVLSTLSPPTSIMTVPRTPYHAPLS